MKTSFAHPYQVPEAQPGRCIRSSHYIWITSVWSHIAVTFLEESVWIYSAIDLYFADICVPSDPSILFSPILKYSIKNT